MKKWPLAVSSSILALGLLAPTIEAASLAQQQEERIPILVALNEQDVSKEQLVKRLKELLPDMFSSYKNSDFQMNSMSHYYAGDDVTRYDIMFRKTVNNKIESGNVTFAGDHLEVESLSFNPVNTKDALFPGKVTGEEAQKIAENFIKKVTKTNNFILESDVPSYYSSRVLTEPMTYSYTFNKTENDVPIQDNLFSVIVLGDGQVMSFYQSINGKKRLAFEDKSSLMSSEDAVRKFKENIQLELQFMINHNVSSGEPYVQLVYQPVSTIMGLHATSNKWYTMSGLSEAVPTQVKLERLAQEPLKQSTSITLEQAKEMAKKLANKNEGDGKFNIDSASEMEMNGQSIISISYSYTTGNSTHGSSIDFNKNTGELTSYSDFTRFMNQQTEEKSKSPKLTQDKVLAIAMEAVKEFAPATLHEYAKPVSDSFYDEQSGSHHVTFPKIKNGLIVNGDDLSVTIGDDGKLSSYYRSAYKVDEWPDPKSAIEKSRALATFNEALSAKLVYTKLGTQNQDESYKLVYMPMVKGKGYYLIDAKTGQIVNSLFDSENKVTVTHPTAEKELNYLIQAGAIDVKNASQFNADAAITKGQALNTIIKSLTYFYYDSFDQNAEKPTSFENIDPQHPLYQIVENASTMGILKPGQETFNPDEKLTREELAVWFIRTLGLEQAAKHSDLYNVAAADKDKINPQFKGYVALSQVLGLQKLDQSNFNPTREVTYADLAVSIIQLSYEIAEKRQAGMIN